MYIVLWEYMVGSGHEAEFEKIYGVHGEWAQLFAQGEGYLGTDLVQDIHTPRRYVTIDRWVSSQAYQTFYMQYHAAYKALDARCQSLTEQENLICAGDVFPGT